MTSLVGFTRLVAFFMRVSSVFLALAGVNLLFAAWLHWTRHQPFWALCWLAGGVAFIAVGVVSLLDLAGRVPTPLTDVLRPLLKLGAVALALAGPAWAVQTEIRWEQTGDFEAYGIVIGAIMAAYGVTAWWWWERRDRQEREEGPKGART